MMEIAYNTKFKDKLLETIADIERKQNMEDNLKKKEIKKITKKNLYRE